MNEHDDASEAVERNSNAKVRPLAALAELVASRLGTAATKDRAMLACQIEAYVLDKLLLQRQILTPSDVLDTPTLEPIGLLDPAAYRAR